MITLPFDLGQDIYDITEFVNGDERPEMYSERLDYIGLHLKDGVLMIETPDGVDYKLEDFGSRVFTDVKQAEHMAVKWMSFHAE